MAIPLRGRLPRAAGLRWSGREGNAPLSGFRTPAIVASVVVLPAPLAPIKATSSPSLTLRERSRTRHDAAVLDLESAKLKHSRPL